MPRHRQRVALLLEPWPEFRQAIRRGIHHFAQTHPEWEIRSFFPLQSPRPETRRRLRDWRPQGVIAALPDAGWARFVAGLRIPSVDVANNVASTPVARVTIDDVGVGRLAADYLAGLERSCLACIQPREAYWARLRIRGFCQRLACQGVKVARMVPPFTEPQLADWLRHLPRPLGLFIGDDHIATLVFRACAKANLSVPDTAAILGATDEPVYCEYTPTPLSSIPWPGEQVGTRAATLLHNMMAGQRPPEHPTLVLPQPVAERESTRCFGSPDPLVRAALRSIHGRGGFVQSVKELAGRMNVTPRRLERCFRSGWSRSAHEELRELRLRHAKRLLSETRLPVSEVARRSGFGSHAAFCIFFRSATGRSPTDFRIESVRRASGRS